MKSSFVLITPEIARTYLEKSIGNRPLDDTRIRLYENEMKSGKWTVTPDSISFDLNGNLTNGHHRLTCIVKTGLSFHFFVVEGLPENAFHKTDTGKIRSSGDVLAIIGAKNYRGVSSIIQSYLKYKKGRTVNSVRKHSVGLTNENILETYNQNPERWQTVFNKVMTWYKDILMIVKPSFLGGVYSLLYEIDPVDADYFFTHFSKGTNLTERSPIKLVRDYFIENYKSKRKASEKEKYGIIIKSWNFYRLNKECKVLKFDIKREEIQKAI